jgi:crossover junction endodeoxyribonuclease RuvC
LQNNQSVQRILGVDPGTNVLGFAVLEIKDKQLRIVCLDVLHLAVFGEQQFKLKRILEDLQYIIERHRPTVMAIEAPFYGKNVQSMLKLGRAQGVAIAAAMSQGLEIAEYSPKKIKQSVTGNGNASKEQVAAMLATILNVKLDDVRLDATDALATALCHHFQTGSVLGGQKRYKGWDDFLKAKPDRRV